MRINSLGDKQKASVILHCIHYRCGVRNSSIGLDQNYMLGVLVMSSGNGIRPGG